MELSRNKINNEIDLMVTIQCITYNHKSFIHKCLDGFVMQKTKFRFEAIVHDDASMDGTAAIVLEYAKKYPEIIKPIIETENQYSKHDGSLSRIMNVHTHGKYVAICEGDDYWTDSLKLQKQVDFLESHSDYSMCFHNAIVHYENKSHNDHPFAKIDDREYSRIDLTENWLAPTASFLFRKSVIESDLYLKVMQSKKLISGDYPLMMCASYCGKVYGMSSYMCVYRKHPNGVMQQFDKMNYKVLIHCIEIKKIMGKDLKPLLSKSIGSHFVIGLKMIKNGTIVKGLWLAVSAFVYEPKYSIKSFLYWSNKFYH